MNEIATNTRTPTDTTLQLLIYSTIASCLVLLILQVLGRETKIVNLLNGAFPMVIFFYFMLKGGGVFRFIDFGLIFFVACGIAQFVIGFRKLKET